MDQSQSISTDSNLRLGNSTFYTVVAIDYPESSLGGTYIGRHGVTPGFMVNSGSKIYDSSRALHLWVWNNDTDSWIPDSYFRGLRLNGHCYDTYSGYGSWPTELTYFAEDYNKIKQQFPNCTYIVTGSHRDSYRNSTVRNILYQDLGLPGGTALDSDYVAAPEWILIGSPSTPRQNPYVWVYENNNSQSAVASVGLGNIGKGINYLTFNGTNRVTTDIPGINSEVQYSRVIWVRPTSHSGDMKSVMLNSIGNNSDMAIGFQNGYPAFHQYTNSNGPGTSGDLSITGATYVNTNTTCMVAITVDRSITTNNVKIYLNGVLDGTGSRNLGTSNSTTTILGGPSTDSYGGARMFYGDLFSASHYNRLLSSDEIKEIFSSKRGRYGL